MKDINEILNDYIFTYGVYQPSDKTLKPITYFERVFSITKDNLKLADILAQYDTKKAIISLDGKQLKESEKNYYLDFKIDYITFEVKNYKLTCYIELKPKSDLPF